MQFSNGPTHGDTCLGTVRARTRRQRLFGDVLFTYGSTLLALGYAAGITLLARHDRGRRLLTPLGAAGRMALTVYLSGSIMFGTLFYSFAFGKAFYLGPAAVTGYAVLFFAARR